MDWITWTAIGALALLCLGVWLYLRKRPGQKPRGDDWGGEL